MGAVYSQNMKKSFSTLPIVLFGLGVLLGITLSTLAAWADYESASYGFAHRANSPFRGLSCPILMTQGESQTVKIKMTNTSGRAIHLSMRTEISTRLTPDTQLEFFDLAPGESMQAQRTIGPDNVDFGQFIFVKAGIFSAYPLPDQENTCGIFILPMQGNGFTILITTTILSILLIAGGMFMFRKIDGVKRNFNGLLFIAVATLLAMVFSFSGLWIQSTLLLVLAILAGFIMLGVTTRQ